ncbi:RNA polymerase sigma factor [Paenibacillus eucommiae]|uniref:RNA polymerase sigma-70 factor (ECF subfamily) n=1 Tax=Paenibacillus eucommiae TaxID=1355755 RepID=A0ABS4IMG8_9BACL|nr:RNA polymerase sigma factor [Paenibacillus eucommiae]MBP1988767.1 RNA polymerase sigma-70 factor (ECF subfamily) [Paenibacillus eucommiae]
MISDEELLEQIAHGNEASLEALVYRYHKPIFEYLQRMLNNSSLAEDLSQECFIRLCQTVRTGRLPSRFRPWIYRIATNLCKDVWKSSAYRKESLWEAEKLSLHSDSETVSSILERQWERESVIRALGSLAVDEREIIILRFYHELKLDEIAEMLEQPLGSIKTKLYKTFKKMAHLLNTEEVDKHGTARRQR